MCVYNINKMGRKSMRGGSPASRLVMSMVKTANVKCNDKLSAVSNTHDVSSGDFYATTGGGRKKNRKSKKAKSLSIPKQRIIFFGKKKSKGRKGKRRTRTNNCNGGAKTDPAVVVI